MSAPSNVVIESPVVPVPQVSANGPYTARSERKLRIFRNGTFCDGARTAADGENANGGGQSRPKQGAAQLLTENRNCEESSYQQETGCLTRALLKTTGRPTHVHSEGACANTIDRLHRHQRLKQRVIRVGRLKQANTVSRRICSANPS